MASERHGESCTAVALFTEGDCMPSSGHCVASRARGLLLFLVRTDTLCTFVGISMRRVEESS